MTDIDWDAAPEGVTHKDNEYPGGFWYKFDFENNTAAYCPPWKSEWTEAGKASDYNDGSMDSMVSISGPALKEIPATETPTANEDCERALAVMLKDSLGEDGSGIQHAVARRLYKAGYRKVQP